MGLWGGLCIALALLGSEVSAINSVPGGALPLLVFLILLVVLAADWVATAKQPPVRLERHLPTGLALNQWVSVHITVRHAFSQAKTIRLFDGIPANLLNEGAHTTVVLQAGQHTQRSYRVRAMQRGPLLLERCWVEIAGPCGFWLDRYEVPLRSEAKVYPDFAAITSYTLLASENHTSQLGIRTRNRRGQGSAFHQLRDYRQGDSLRQLDWNATARRMKLISKEYQEERDQNLVLMIDSGRRMRSQDDQLNHFDHALNTSLLISYIALRQGDSVGVMSFGNGERWIAPQKGAERVNVILNGLYDLHAGSNAPDYLAAAEKLVTLQSKRSLVIIITNSRDEEAEELLAAVSLLRKRHLVLLANLREASIDAAFSSNIHDADDAALYAGAVEYVRRRDAVQRNLRARKVISVDCSAVQLPAQLANAYWEVKRAGLL